MAPCFLLLDNLDIILGKSNSDESDDDITSVNVPTDTSNSDTGRAGVGRGSRRASSVAFDRMLSTLLVEIDGIGDAAPAAESSTATGTRTFRTITM